MLSNLYVKWYNKVQIVYKLVVFALLIFDPTVPGSPKTPSPLTDCSNTGVYC